MPRFFQRNEVMKNTFVSFLEQLEVKHTQSFSDDYFSEHPHKDNLFGLSKMLSDYGVKNAAIRIPDKENNIAEIETPFIAQFGGSFVAVHEVKPDNVSFFWKGANHVLEVAKFIEGWTGLVLLAETSEKSIEPDYQIHRKTETLNLLKKIALFSAIGLIIALAYINNKYHSHLGGSLLILINLAGMYISWLLLLKQMRIQSQYADKICSLFKQKDCNNVLESEAAKLFGIIGWSEIGLGYFSANVLLLLISPTTITSIALLNLLTLPFTLWSVWYQKVKAKQWCVLCLIVVTLLWSVFIINLLFAYIPFEVFSFPNNSQLSILNSQFAITASCYCIMVLGIHFLAPKLNSEKTIQSLRQSMNSMKADEDLFITLLKKQPYYETGDFDSVIRFGNPDSKLHITILSNPYCNPCAKMHKRVEELLKQVNNNINIQYILSSFGEMFNSTNKYLIAACLKDNTNSPMKIFNDWFEKGKALRDEFFKDLNLDMENPEIEIEFQKHEAWKKKTQIMGTPTVLVNGYKLPESYKIEDLRYFTDLDLL